MIPFVPRVKTASPIARDVLDRLFCDVQRLVEAQCWYSLGALSLIAEACADATVDGDGRPGDLRAVLQRVRDHVRAGEGSEQPGA